MSTPENCGELFMSAYLKGEYPYPFVQKVEKRQQGWLKIGPGWVKDGDVEALKTEPITEDALSNQPDFGGFNISEGVTHLKPR